MADYTFNVAKGRAGELFERVKNGDPAAARLYLIPLSATPAQAAGEDVDDFAALITAGATERTTGNWNRKTLAAADIAALAPDDTNNRFDYNLAADPSWSPGPTTGNNVVALVLCYASLVSPTNAQLLPMEHFDFPITADGSVVTAVRAATGVFRGS